MYLSKTPPPPLPRNGRAGGGGCGPGGWRGLRSGAGSPRHGAQDEQGGRLRGALHAARRRHDPGRDARRARVAGADARARGDADAAVLSAELATLEQTLLGTREARRE